MISFYCISAYGTYLKIEVYLNAKILEISNFLTNAKLEIGIFVCYIFPSLLFYIPCSLYLLSSIHLALLAECQEIPLYDIYRGGVLVMKILV